jgi:hypothetical protein
MADQFREARERAKRTIQDRWSAVAQNRTMGWGGPIEAIEQRYPFIRASTAPLGKTVSRPLPILIFQSRETPPAAMEVAVPYADATGNPYNARLVASGPISAEHVALLSEFAQAVWFAIDQQMLPAPGGDRRLADALVAWTGKALVAI